MSQGCRIVIKEWACRVYFVRAISIIGYDGAYEIVQIAETVDIVGFEES